MQKKSNEKKAPEVNIKYLDHEEIELKGLDNFCFLNIKVDGLEVNIKW